MTPYGLMLLLGLLAAWALARRTAPRVGIEPSHADLLAPTLVLAGLLGAVAFGLLSDTLAPAPAHGRVLYGSLLCATTAGIGYGLLAGLPLGRLGDMLAAPVALGVAFGRAGCFLAGCCWGRPCGAGFLLGVRYPTGSFAWHQQVAAGMLPPEAPCSLPVHPAQLYEAAAMLLVAVFLHRLRRPISGEKFLILGLAYAVVRFLVEFCRADNPPAFGPLSFSQGICILTIAACIVTAAVRRALAGRLGLRLPA